MEGKILGNRYELLQKIGGGGMAIVFKAKCKLLNRFVAIKILRPDFTTDNEFINRFKVESQAAASLSHPNIVPIYDVGNENDIHYIVMEYVDGKTLKEYITEKGALPWRTAVNIAIQICSALEHAHKNHIVHRDIKPHNIIITKELIAKVTDFGIARAASSSTLTMTGNTIGSVHYFSPEQARGGYTDEKSDLYSLGIVLYEMLTGTVPFDAESPVTIALKHLEDEIQPPIEISPNIPLSINNIILKAVQKNQANRYQSASEMLADLNIALKEPNGDFVKIVNNNFDDQPTQRIPISSEMRNSRIKSENNKGLIQGESEDMAVKKKSDRATVIAALVTSLVIIALITFAASYFIYSKITNKTIEIKTPNLIGMQVDDAREILRQNGITLKTETRFDEKTPKGNIIAQTPDADMKIKSPGEIKVVVSDGQEMVKVPDLTSMSTKDAQYELQKYGLQIKTIYEHSSEMPQDYAIRQNPAPYSLIAKNSQIEVFISNGLSPKAKVPNLIGITESQARNLVSQNKLVLGEVNYSSDSDKPYGVVLSQSLVSESEVDNFSKIDIVVNSYKESSTVEKATKSIPIDLSSISKIGSFEVKVIIEDITGHRTAYQHNHTSADGLIDIRVSGKGSAIIRVYIDDDLNSEMVIDFDGEEQ